MTNERAWWITIIAVLVLAATAVDLRGQTAYGQSPPYPSQHTVQYPPGGGYRAQGPMAQQAAHPFRGGYAAQGPMAQQAARGYAAQGPMAQQAAHPFRGGYAAQGPMAQQAAYPFRGGYAAQGPMAQQAAFPYVAPAGMEHMQMGNAFGTRACSAFSESAMSDPNQGTIGGLKSTLPVVPERSRQAADRLQWNEIFEGVTGSDAAVEVTLGHGRILTLKTDITGGGRMPPVIAVGNPSVVDFRMVGPKHLRLVGQRIGQTDLSITAANGETYSLEVTVIADLKGLRAQLAMGFPDASVKLTQLGGQILLEGEARDTRQVREILETIYGYLATLQVTAAVEEESSDGAGDTGRDGGEETEGEPSEETTREEAPGWSADEGVAPLVINLLRVPGPQQVLLKVQIAELDRTALRQIGNSLDLTFGDGTSSIVTNVVGTITNATLGTTVPPQTNLFSASAILDNVTSDFALNALRTNSVLKTLAEPNLIAMNGHEASFLSGGRYPYQVAQASAGASTVFTIEWIDFGVELRFVPFILDDGRIRLIVAPEVSELGEVVTTQGYREILTRSAQTTVEMRQGQSLAIAGLIFTDTGGTRDSTPWLGDLPLAGHFFRTAENRHRERELLVVVSPYLVEAVDECTSPPLPGDEVDAPNDLELFLFGRIESRTLHKKRPTTCTYEGCPAPAAIDIEDQYMQGEQGFSP